MLLLWPIVIKSNNNAAFMLFEFFNIKLLKNFSHSKILLCQIKMYYYY